MLWNFESQNMFVMVLLRCFLGRWNNTDNKIWSPIWRKRFSSCGQDPNTLPQHPLPCTSSHPSVEVKKVEFCKYPGIVSNTLLRTLNNIVPFIVAFFPHDPDPLTRILNQILALTARFFQKKSTFAISLWYFFLRNRVENNRTVIVMRSFKKSLSTASEQVTHVHSFWLFIILSCWQPDPFSPCAIFLDFALSFPKTHLSCFFV